MNARRQVGFIRNYSSKQLPVFQEEPSEFSYFRVRNQDQQDQFSPYKMEEDVEKTKLPQRPPLPVKNKGHKPEIVMKALGVQINARLKERMNSSEHRNEKSKQKLHSNIVTLRDKIEQLDTVLQQLKVSRSSENIRKSTKKEEQPRPSSSSSSSESEEVVVNSIPSPKMSIERIKEAQRVQSINERRESSSKQNSSKQDSNHQSSLSQQENLITFNSRISNQPLQIKKYSSSSEQDSQVPEQESQESHYFEDKQQTRKIEENRPLNTAQQTIAKKELHQNKGGICFDIDTKQFTEPVIQPRQERRPVKKPTKVDKKAEILLRRQTAKAYDKMARKALFTAYH